MTPADSAIERIGYGSEDRCWWVSPPRCWRSSALFWIANNFCAPISSAICIWLGMAARMPGHSATASHRRRQMGDDDPPHVRSGGTHGALHDYLDDSGLIEPSRLLSVGTSGSRA